MRSTSATLLPPVPKGATFLLAIAAAAATLGACVAAAGWMLIPQMMGLRAVNVSSTSMEPALSPGDLVFFDPNDTTPAVGNVVLFKTSAGVLTSHRVSRVTKTALFTRGDANAAEDTEELAPQRVEGVAAIRIPAVGTHPGAVLAISGFGAAVAAVALGALARGSTPSRKALSAAALVALVAGAPVDVDATAGSLTTSDTDTWSSVFEPSQVLTPASVPPAPTANMQVAGTVYATAEHEGILYVAGDFTRIGGADRSNVAAFDLHTATLTSWNPAPNAPKANTAAVYTLSIDALNDTLYVGGTFTSIAGASRSRLAAFNLAAPTNPTLSSWNPKPNSTVFATAVDPGTAQLFVGGQFTKIGATTRKRLASFNAVTLSGGGALAAGFNPAVPNGAVMSLEADTAQLYFGGTFTKMWADSTQNRLAAVDKTSGAKLPGFTANANKPVYALEWVAANNMLWVGGSFTAVGGANRRGVAQLSPLSGAQDPGVNKVVDSGQVNTLAYDPVRDFMYLGGTFNKVGGVQRPRLAVVAATPSTATVGAPLSWNPAPDGGAAVTQSSTAPAPASSTTAVFSLRIVNTAAGAAQPGAVAVGGNFTVISNSERQSVTVTDAAPQPSSTQTGFAAPQWATAATPTAKAPLVVKATAVIGDRLFVAGSFTAVNDQPRRRLAVFELPEATLGAPTPGFNASVSALAVGPGSVLYVGGSFSAVNDPGGMRHDQPKLVAVNSASLVMGAFDAGFAAGSGSVNCVVVAGDATVFAGGDFSGSVGGSPRSRLAAFSGTGALLGFNPAINGAVHSLALTADATLFIGGSFTTANSLQRHNLAALHATTGAVSGWDPNMNAAVRALHLWPTANPSSLLVGGEFTAAGGTGRARAASYALDTLALTAWAPTADGPVDALGSIPGGQVLLGGRFGALNGVPRARFAAVDPTSGATAPWNAGLTAVSVNTVAVHAEARRVVMGGEISAVGGYPGTGLAFAAP